MDKSLRYTFRNGRTAAAIRVSASMDLPLTLSQINLALSHPTIVIVGGAKRLGESDIDQLLRLFGHRVTPVAESLGAAVVDGGIDSGVMRLIGQARAEMDAHFPMGKSQLYSSWTPIAESCTVSTRAWILIEKGKHKHFKMLCVSPKNPR